LNYRTHLEKTQALANHIQPGNPYNNAQTEANWRTLKIKLLPHCGAFASLEEAY
jgi:hypothetical protein